MKCRSGVGMVVRRQFTDSRLEEKVQDMSLAKRL